MIRDITLTEMEYWVAIDAGIRVLPPEPCRECGQVWEHHKECDTNK